MLCVENSAKDTLNTLSHLCGVGCDLSQGPFHMLSIERSWQSLRSLRSKTSRHSSIFAFSQILEWNEKKPNIFQKWTDSHAFWRLSSSGLHLPLVSVPEEPFLWLDHLLHLSGPWLTTLKSIECLWITIECFQFFPFLDFQNNFRR